MSKYKEAKQYIDMILRNPSWSRVDINWLAIEQIKELLDREIPNKYTKNDKTTLGCINNDCRQKIDWNDEK